MYYRLVFLMMLFSFANPSFANNIIIKGTVIDGTSGEPIPFVSVYVPGSTAGTTTNANGDFHFSAQSPVTKIEASFIGFKTAVHEISGGKTQGITIEMFSDSKMLSEVVVQSKKLRYRNKDNPAVELIRNVIQHKNENRLSAYDYLSFQEYEKIQFALSNNPEKLRNNFLVRRYAFMESSIDTTKVEGKAILPLYMEENISENYLSFRPDRKNKTIIANKEVSFDKDFIDGEGIGVYIRHLYQPIDIYDNNINLVTNQFMSPIADLSPTFYKFFIRDTVEVNGEKLVDLHFAPRNSTDFLFVGNMYVTLDGNYAVQRVNIHLDKNINLNWVQDLRIFQEFEQNETGKYNLSRSKLAINFGLSKNSDGGIYGERLVSLKNFTVNEKIPDSVFSQSQDTVIYEAQDNDSVLAANRHEHINYSEEMVYANMDSLQNLKSLKRALNILMTVVAGYTKVNDYFEIGPVNTFYSFNPVEGLRLRAGGRTTPNFHKNFYMEGYGAYGFKDQKWKYFIGGTYSFTGKDRFDFPARRLTISYQKDTKIPGQELEFIQEDNILLSIKRGVNDKWLYNSIFNIEYLREFNNNMSYKIGFKNWRQQAAGGLEFIREGSNNTVQNITTSEFLIEFRWAPNEKFYQGKSYRIPFPNRYPIFTFRAATGLKGFMGGEYNYQRINLNIFKRVYLSQLGFSDVNIEGGYIFGKVPFALLNIPRANQTYSYQLSSYNLMNFLEFVNDQFVSVQLEHNFNGFFLNKIPLIKKLRFREIITVKALYGGLRNENMPNNRNEELFQFPTDEHGNLSTFSLVQQPYIEGSVGIGNILNFFRVDLVKRFTYLDHPNVSELGIRARFRFDF